MIRNFFLPIFILFFAISCTVEDDNQISENLPPSEFEVIVAEVTDRSAGIHWTSSIDPEGEEVLYKIILNDEQLEDNFQGNQYYFEGLSHETGFTGKIIATDGEGETSQNFSFTTGEFIPKIHEGHVFLTSQNEVEEFGAKGYNIVTGQVKIEAPYIPSSDIDDLSPLLGLMEVHGDFTIHLNLLKDLSGLNELTMIGGRLSIQGNNYLESLIGLGNLKTVNKRLTIAGNDLLEDLAPLENVLTIGEIFITNNDGLKFINLLENAEVVDHIYILNNPSLERIEGMEQIKEIIYDLEISQNENLTSIPSFNELVNIGGGLYFHSSEVEIIGFPKLQNIKYMLEIMKHPFLVEIKGFQELKGVRDLFIWYNPMLSDFCNFTNLVNEGEVQSMFSISGNGFDPSKEDIQNGHCKI